MVDGIYDTSAQSSQYQARSTEELENIKTLVKSAIGFQSTRGDEIQVISMPFAHETAEVASTYDWLFGLNKNDLFHFIEILAFIGIGLLLTLNVIKPFFKNFMVVFNSIKPLISKPILDEEQIEDTQKRQPPQAIQLKNVSGLVQSDTVDTIHSLLEDYPQQAAKVVNSWLNER
jgi:flagellar M-ring protein FliF